MNKKLKSIIMVVLSVAMLLTMVACNGQKKSEKSQEQTSTVVKYPMTIKDSTGKEVTIDKEPQKIVSIAPNITEIIYALGKGNLLVGRTDYCDYPAEVKNVPSIGGLVDPNVEKIIELQPDVVIASTHFKEDVEKKLEDLHIKVVVLNANNQFEEVYTGIEIVGKILNANEKAKEVVDGMKSRIAKVVKDVEGKSKPKVYYVVGFGKTGDFTSGGDTFIGKMIEMASGDNIAKDVKGWNYSLEKIVENNPEIIITTKYYDTKAQFMSTPGYQELEAVKKGNVIEIDSNLLDRPGPRLAEGMEELAKILHPAK